MGKRVIAAIRQWWRATNDIWICVLIIVGAGAISWLITHA